MKSEREGERDNRAITQADYEELGGVTRSLTQRADQEYEELVKRDPAYEKTIQHVMLRMVAVGGDELVRRRVSLSELEYPEPENGRVREIIQRFSAARLLVCGIDAEGKSYVEPAHDALVRGWQKLLVWKKEEQESLILQRRLTPAAEEWKSQKQVQFLWNADPRLDLLKQVLKSHDNWFNRAETEFVQRSVRQKRKNRKNVVTRWSIVASALTVLTVLTITRLIQSQRNNLRAIAAVVQNLAPVKPMDALLRAVEANDQMFAWSVVDVQSSLLSAIQMPKERTILEVQGQSLVTSVAVVSDGRIVSGSNDGTLVLWNRQGNQIAKTYPIGAAINSLATCSKAPLIVIVSGGGSVRLWNLQDNATPQIIERNNFAINAVAFSSNCQTIVAGSDNGVRLWNQQGKQIGNSLRYPQGITAVAFSPDGQLIAGGSQDGTIFLWDARGNWKRSTSFVHPRGVNAVAFSPNSQFIVTGGNDGQLRLWDRKGNSVGDAFRGHENRVTSVAFSPNNQFIVSGSYDNSVRLWDLKGNQLGDPLQGHESWVRAIAISPDGHSIASVSNDSTVRLWDVKNDVISPAFLQGYQRKVRVVAISADGQRIASGDQEDEGTVRLWDSLGNPIGKISQGHKGSVWAIAMTDDGKTIASGGDDGTIRLWDSLGNQISAPFTVKDSRIGADTFSPYNFSPYEQFIANNSYKSLVIGAVALSLDGQFIASGSNDAIVRVWNKQGKLREFPKVHTLPIESIAFSPDGQFIASGSQDNTLQLWSMDTGKPNGPRFQGHSGWVSAIAFSPDAQFIATGSWDNTVRLWDRKGNAMGRPFRGHSSWISAIRFISNGQLIISGSADKTVRLWQGGDWRTWRRVACSQLSNYYALKDTKDEESTKRARDICATIKSATQ